MVGPIIIDHVIYSVRLYNHHAVPNYSEFISTFLIYYK